ncbi:hypothetical protein B0H17DRAFT_1123589 [Mycena rosella]|uniref:Uncharacterized protein n=1 Tax=Mycena rosella TaxID=1033263 RepID=A0AAD7H2L2_MYCRO|nr:hypothetical protein B0H17DRAFT_1123589 [Mycena rosella]
MLSVLSTLLLVSTIHSSPTARSASPASKRGLGTSVIWQGLGPLPLILNVQNIDYDARSPQVEDGQWFHLVDGGPGVEVSPGTQVGWRLTDEPNSEIVFYMTANPVFLTASYTGSGANQPNPVTSFGNVGAATFQGWGGAESTLYLRTKERQPTSAIVKASGPILSSFNVRKVHRRHGIRMAQNLVGTARLPVNCLRDLTPLGRIRVYLLPDMFRSYHHPIFRENGKHFFQEKLYYVKESKIPASHWLWIFSAN